MKVERKEKFMRKYNYEILFNDSAEYFAVFNAKMIQEGNLIRFICFNNDNTYKCDEWYPAHKIHRIKRYAKSD